MRKIEKTIIDYFGGIPHIVSVVLFGSYAQNTENESSDVDVAIFCDPAHVPDPFLLISWREGLSGLLCKDVDLVCLNTASPIIGMQVYKHGKVLIINDHKKYVDNQIRLFVDYAELKELRDPMERNILKRKYYDRS